MLPLNTRSFNYKDPYYYLVNGGIAIAAGILGGIQQGPIGAILGVSVWTVATVTRPIFDLCLNKLELRQAQKLGCGFPPALLMGLLVGPFITQGIAMLMGSNFRAVPFIQHSYSFHAIKEVAHRHFNVVGVILLAGAGAIGWTASRIYSESKSY
jgi:hypothetical protein